MRTKEQEQAAYNGLSPAKIAKRWGCSKVQVLKLIDSEALRAIDISDPETKHPRWSILPEDLDAYEKAHENRPRSDAA